MRPRSWRLFATTAVVAGGLVAGLAVAPAAEAARPSLGLAAVHFAIDANTAPQFRVALANLPRGSATYLQRQYGSANVWKNAVRLTHSHYTLTAPKVGMGRFVYRLHTSYRGRGYADSAVKGVFGYGTVRIETICNARDDGEASCYDQKQTSQVGSRLFAYTVDMSTGDYPDFGESIYVGRSSCRYLSLDFADDNGDDQAVSYLQVTQTASDTKTVAVGGGQVGHVAFPLDGGPYSLNASSNDDSSVGIIGAASCWTISGTR